MYQAGEYSGGERDGEDKGHRPGAAGHFECDARQEEASCRAGESLQPGQCTCSVGFHR